MLVRSWNLFHGNTWPPQRHAYLDEMIELATADGPDVLCVQEVPAWALRRFTVGDVAERPLLTATIGRALTAPNHGLIRSAFEGQGNAMWIAPRLRLVDHRILVLNPGRFRRQQGLPPQVERGWGKERRIVQVVRLDTGTGTIVVANVHCTSYHGDDRPAEAELTRAAWFAESVARRGEPLVLAGDFNLRPGSPALDALAGDEWNFSAPGPRIDHILVRGAPVTPLRVWDDDRRRRSDGTLLADHAPVEVEVG